MSSLELIAWKQINSWQMENGYTLWVGTRALHRSESETITFAACHGKTMEQDKISSREMR